LGVSIDAETDSHIFAQMIRNILLIGAGRSSASLIQYLLDHSKDEQWTLTVADVSEEEATKKINNHPNGRAIRFDINDEKQRIAEIGAAGIVISMLPANMHLPVALECVSQKKSLLTASYISPEMKALESQVIANGSLFLNECGLDPGLDHMSAMKIIDSIHASGGEITSFKSYTGGLVAPESNDNPWGYKFSWNPRNVILAGQGTAKYISGGRYHYVPYNRLFGEAVVIKVDETSFDGYANRDSLAYRKTYGLDHIPTMIRGTLRQLDFCKAWNVFVQLGITDDSYKVENSESLTYAQFIEAFLPSSSKGTALDKLIEFAGEPADSELIRKIIWTGVLEDKPIGLKNASPAQVLQQLLETKWVLKDGDRDMIVMQHEFVFNDKEKAGKKITSSLVVKGEDRLHTAMAKTVGLPLAIAARLILNGKIRIKGIHIPVQKEIYEPVLSELEKMKIVFSEKELL